MNNTRRFESEDTDYSPDLDPGTRARRREHEQRRRQGERPGRARPRGSFSESRHRQHLPARFFLDGEDEGAEDALD